MVEETELLVSCTHGRRPCLLCEKIPDPSSSSETAHISLASSSRMSLCFTGNLSASSGLQRRLSSLARRGSPAQCLGTMSYTAWQACAQLISGPDFQVRNELPPNSAVRVSLINWGCEATPILGSCGFLPFNLPPAYVSSPGTGRSAHSGRLLPPLTTSLPAYLKVSLISPTHQLRSVITDQ